MKKRYPQRVNLKNNLHDFINHLAAIVKRLHSESALLDVLEGCLFGGNNILLKHELPFEAKMGYLIKINRDLDEFFPPDFLPRKLPKRYHLREVLFDYFKKRTDNETGIIALQGGTLYRYMFYQRDVPLEPYLSLELKTDLNIDDKIRKKIKGKVGKVLYIPLFGRWHQMYMLMLEFELKSKANKELLKNTSSLLSSSFSHFLNSTSLSVLNTEHTFGKVAEYIFRQWKTKIDQHAEVIYHSSRVAQIATILAEDPILQIRDSDRSYLSLASLFHDWGKTKSTHKMSEQAELDSRDVKELRERNYKRLQAKKGAEQESTLVELINDNETKSRFKSIILRKNEWDDSQAEYDRHPLYSAEDMLLESGLYNEIPIDEWRWLIPVICHHQYTKDEPLASANLNITPAIKVFMDNLGIKGCKTVEDIIDYAKKNDVFLKRSIDIVSVADDIDGDVSPSTYRQRSKYGPATKIKKILDTKNKFPYYDNEVIKAVERNRSSILSVYSAPVNLANI